MKNGKPSRHSTISRFHRRFRFKYKYFYFLNHKAILFANTIENRDGSEACVWHDSPQMHLYIEDMHKVSNRLFLTSSEEKFNLPTRKEYEMNKDVKLGKFELQKVVTLTELKDKTNALEEADYTDRVSINGELHFFQFKFIPPETEVSKFVMTKGAFYLEQTNSGIKPRKIETRTTKILDSAKSAVEIRTRIDAFFNKLDVFREEGIENPKRGMLIHSGPGVGKTTIITKIMNEYVQEHNTCALVWPSDIVHPDDMQEFLGSDCDWSGIDRFILVIEDLGGGSDIWGAQHQKTPAALLNFLDGIEAVFKKPTYIIATTNNADAFQSNLNSRPGRFDVVLGLPPPSKEDRLNLLKFFAKDRWNFSKSEENELARLTEGFSAAHLKEVYLRSRIDDKTMFETADEIKKHIDKIKSNVGLSTEKKGSGPVGFGGGSWDEE